MKKETGKPRYRWNGLAWILHRLALDLYQVPSEIEVKETHLAEQKLCPHGFVLADNVCGPCSEGRPMRMHSQEIAWIKLEVLKCALGIKSLGDKDLFERLESFYMGAYERGSQGYDESLLGAEERIASLTASLMEISREDPGGYFAAIADKALGNTT